MGNPLTTIESHLSDIIHRTRIAVETAVKNAEAKAEQEKATLAADIKAAVAAVEAKVKADAPEIEAAIKKGVADAKAALEAVLAARGL